jgi:hypothetical protein
MQVCTRLETQVKESASILVAAPAHLRFPPGVGTVVSVKEKDTPTASRGLARRTALPFGALCWVSGWHELVDTHFMCGF